MKHIFIINPISGKEDAGRLLVPRIIEACKRAGVEYETIPTQAPRHATEIAQEYSAAGDPVRFYSVGGDGTLNEILLGAYPFPNAEVSAVPCGSGNDFVRSFSEPDIFLDLRQQICGKAVEIDLIGVDDGGVSAAITSAGLDAEVAYNIPKYRRIPFLGGTMAYNISILEKLMKKLGKRLRLEIDGKVREGDYLISAVCNGQTYGGGYRAAPDAVLNDGVLEYVLVKKMSRARIATVIGKYKKGAHVKNGRVVPELRDVIEYGRAREIVIKPVDKGDFILNVDGECGPAPRLYAKVMPRAAKFVLPELLYQQYREGNVPALTI